MRTDRDILWKGVIEEVFDDLLRFVFPAADEVFDLRRRCVFLDKELAQLYPEPQKPSTTRLVDKLVRVFRRDGGSEWLLVHLEVQGKAEPGFSSRMFQYYYRILDRWQCPITAVAILTGKDGHRVPDSYEHSFLGTELSFKYNVLRIDGYKDEELTVSSNPFARVVLIARRAMLVGKLSERNMLELKKEMATALLEMKDLPRRKVWALLRFLNNYIVFKNPATNRIFGDHVDRQKNKRYTMNMLQAVRVINERRAEENGRKKGVKTEREKSVKKLIANSEFSDEKIASLLGVSVVFVAKIRDAGKGKPPRSK
ncbi:hypothetical protein [Puia sp.]|jgi:hypothetical protein|uniref:hypothetical protein n=1 Tax=Puia sp. TaxID=2045100 RepID=UPI002F4235B5